MRTTFTIRPVAQSDAPEWLKMRSELWPDGIREHEGEIASFFAGTLLEPDAVFIAVDGSNRTIGVAELSLRRNIPGLEGKKVGFIEGLYVTPTMRFSGVARALVQASRSWARNQACVGFASDRSGRYITDKQFTRLGRTVQSAFGS